MTHRLAILNVVGLTEAHLGKSTPNITALAEKNGFTPFDPPLPAVTSTVQSSIFTGGEPKDHGVVANGWHERSTHETFFWRQSNDLVEGEKVWDELHRFDPNITVANLFWWFNMYSSVDIAVTPRPQYRADGRKIPDIWTTPNHLRQTLQDSLGQFPLFNFWGPAAGIASSKWIANAAIEVEHEFSPTLSFVYLPHLDYPLQRVGPNHPSIPNELEDIDNVVGMLIDFYKKQHVDVCILSEYGIEEVTGAIEINRVLRKHEYLSVRIEDGREYLDTGKSAAFAVPDHQVAHVYVRDEVCISKVATLLRETEGIEFVYVGNDRGQLCHERSGDIVIVSEKDKWFSHDWWDSPECAPDYQATVDIHKKPGYDPRELILESGWRGSKTRIALKLLMKKFGQRTLFDVITLDATKVKGSHGRTPSMGAPSPLLIYPSCAQDTKKVPHSLPCAALNNLFLEWVTCSETSSYSS